jgi:hypothetical protein
MKTKSKTTDSSPKDRGLNSDEQKRRTNRPKQVFPEGNSSNESEKEAKQKEKEKEKSNNN